jgi:hypothetical protein
MALPRQVQAQLDAAAQIEAQISPTAQPAEPVPAPAPAEPTPAPAEPVPAPEPQPEPTPEPTPAEPKEDPRYKALKGKYDAEVPRLHAANRELETRVQQLAELVRQLQQPKQEPQPEPKQQGATTKDVEDFGGDMVQMVERVSRAIVTEYANALQGEFQKLRSELGAVSQTTAKSAEERFLDKLTSIVPDWQEIDSDERWQDWLREVDPLYGAPRQSLLDSAYNALDASRIAAVFNAWKAQFKPAQSEAPAPKAELARQVAPSKASAPTPTSTPEKPVWTDAMIAEFWGDVRKGKFRGRETEIDRIDQEIHAAIAEGRYRPR